MHILFPKTSIIRIGMPRSIGNGSVKAGCRFFIILILMNLPDNIIGREKKLTLCIRIYLRQSLHRGKGIVEGILI